MIGAAENGGSYRDKPGNGRAEDNATNALGGIEVQSRVLDSSMPSNQRRGLSGAPMAREVVFRSDGLAWESVAAQALAFLAYPADQSLGKRRNAALRLHGALVRLIDDASPGAPLSDEQQQALEFFEGTRGGLNHFEQRLRHRLAAGNVACALILERAGLPVGFPTGFGAHTLLRALEWMAETERVNTRNNERRRWNSSFAALNLCAALCWLLQQRHREGLPVDSILNLGLDTVFVAHWIGVANALGPSIEELWPRRAKRCPQPHFAVAAVTRKM